MSSSAIPVSTACGFFAASRWTEAPCVLRQRAKSSTNKMAEVAQRLGVAASTVSRRLQGTHEFPKRPVSGFVTWPQAWDWTLARCNKILSGDRESRGLAPHRNDFEISMLPHVKEREPDPPRNSGDSQRARYCSAQPEEVRHSTPAHTSASVLFTSPSP